LCHLHSSPFLSHITYPHHVSFIFFLPLFSPFISFLFFFNDTATTEIYTLSLHDALPIWMFTRHADLMQRRQHGASFFGGLGVDIDRKSTRLNSSHVSISYAVFCLKKKKKKII